MSADLFRIRPYEEVYPEDGPEQDEQAPVREREQVRDQKAVADTTWPLSDLGNAERLVYYHGSELRHTRALGWLAWDGRRWAHDDDGEVWRMAKSTVRRIVDEPVLDADGLKRLMRWAEKSEGRGRLLAMIQLAETEVGIPVTVACLDADPLLLNVANGALDLTTGELLRHRREHLMTKLAPVDYSPDAIAATWERFLERVVPDVETRHFLQRAVGYSLTGRSSEHVLLLLHGMGANGKTTFLEAVRMVLGDYAMQTPTSTLLSRRGDASNDVARLRGARFVSAVETDAERRLAEGLVKRLTGGDTITARFLFKEFFEFRPSFTIWLATNHRPRVVGTDHAIWRRLLLVPFEVTIPEDEWDLDLSAKLAAEAPGILAWAVEGCLDWLEHGLRPPENVRAATSRYRAEQDTIADFLEDSCVLGRSMWVANKDLYEQYGKWCAANGEIALSQKALTQALDERGFRRSRSEASGARRWSGLALVTHSQHLLDLPSEPVSNDDPPGQLI